MNKIVVVEDDPLSCALVKYALTGEGRSIVAAQCGRKAIGLIDGEQPDLVVLDCGLPGKPGIEVLRHVRANRRFDKVPVFLVSGRVSPLYQQAMLAEGAQAYFTKPLDLAAFCEAVDKALKDSPGHVH